MAADTPTPAQIAARLTKAQRKLLTGQDVSISGKRLDQLFLMDLLAGSIAGPVLTHKGLAVRAEVEKEAGR